MRFATCRFMPLVILAVFGAALPSTSATIYFDDFNGSSGTDLAGTAPDVRPGSETWASGTADSGIPGVRWKADGSVLASTTGGGGVSAVLPFSPASGNIYELSVRLNPTRTDGVVTGWRSDSELSLALYPGVVRLGSTSAVMACSIPRASLVPA